MHLWKKLFNTTLTGRTRVPKSQSLDVESGGEIDVESGASLKLAGTAISATAAEINSGVSGLTATAAEINRATDISARIVTTTATALSLTVTEHAERIVLINTNSTVANTFTLPLATGTGAKMTLINNLAQTQGSIVIAAIGTTNTLKGSAIIGDTTAETAMAFVTSATSDKMSLNRTTTGGIGPGEVIECWDTATGVWTVQARLTGSGTLATPFSET